MVTAILCFIVLYFFNLSDMFSGDSFAFLSVKLLFKGEGGVGGRISAKTEIRSHVAGYGLF